jgi:hypothetical protein
MNCRINWIGQKYGRLTIQSMAFKKDRNPYFNCICDCGNKTVVVGHLLRSGKAKSCGCLRKETASKLSRKDITGERFGRLIVLKYSHFGQAKEHKSFWKCRCDCGNEVIVSRSNLKSNNTTSCGCFREEIHFRNAVGENNPMWRGGVSEEAYPVEWNKKLREKIRHRDGFACAICGGIQANKNLDVHHIDYDKSNLSPENLISLCSSCHTRTTASKQRVFWKQYFIERSHYERNIRADPCQGRVNKSQE